MSAESPRPLRTFTVCVAVLFGLRVLLGVVALPAPAALVASAVLSAVFVGLPIYALFRASSYPWSPKAAGIAIGAGAVVHVLGFVALRAMPPVGFATVAVQAVVQSAIAFWTLGLGAWVATLIKDKNLILPVSVFLAGLDVFLVFNPEAPTSKILRQAPQVFQSVAVSVPSVRAAQAEGPMPAQIVPQGYVGPADLLFIAAFFVMLYKFDMRVKETVRWLVPVMLAYLLIVLSPWGLGMLPALVPIGATVLAVNWREFKMSKEERAMAVGAVALAVGLAAWGLVAHFRAGATVGPAETLPTGGVQAPPKQAVTPEPAPEG